MTNYEMGFKSTLFNGTSRLNGSFFYYDYSDYQAFIFQQSSGTVTNNDALEAGRLFNELEGCDIHPAAAVAVAGLRQAAARGRIGRKDTILLNITGGGMKKLEIEGKKVPLEPDIMFTQQDVSREAIAARLRDFQKVKSV